MAATAPIGSIPLGGVALSAGASAPVDIGTLLATGNVSPILLVQVTVGKYFPFWTLDSGSIWSTPTTERVVQVKLNGSALDQKNSTAEMTAGSWFWDGSTLYVWTTGGDDPNEPEQVVVGFLRFDFSDANRDINGIQWDGRVMSLPAMSLRKERNFSSIAQVSGGNITLVNADGFFDQRLSYFWDAGEVTIKLGANGLDYSQYKTLAVLTSVGKSADSNSFTLELKERKIRAKKSVPVEFYSRDEFPNMEPDDVGLPKQLAYGKIYGARPVVIDLGNREFKVADHAIRTFNGVKVLTDQTWNVVNFASTDLNTATFTLDAADWNGDQEVSVDFEGRIDSNGELMNNSADIMYDLLNKVGETQIDMASFTTSKALLDLGHVYQNENRRVVAREPSIYINEEVELLEIIQKINIMAGAYVLTSASGEYQFSVFEADQGKNVITFDDLEINDFSIEVEAEREVSKILVKFGNRMQEDSWQTIEVERARNQYFHDEGSAVVESMELNTTSRNDASTIAERGLTQAEHQIKSFTITVPWRGFSVNVGSQVRIQYSRFNIDLILDVLEWKPIVNDAGMAVQMVLGDLYGFSDRLGFWVEDGMTTPDGGSMDWDSTDRTYKRQNSGHWHNDNDFATNSPTDELDNQTSIWSA